MPDTTSKGGVFIDSRTGKVVESQPVEGVQLVPPGGVIDAVAEAAIAAAKAASRPSPTEAVDQSATEPEPARPVKGTTRK